MKTVSFGGWKIDLRCDIEVVEAESSAEQDDRFNELPSSQDIADTLSALFGSEYEVHVHDDGFSDFAVRRGKL